MERQNSLTKRIAAYGGIVVFIIMALEVMIMISPFAFFFYSVFSPVFNFLGQHTATRWATMFFLPHMILPPTAFLKTVRIAGSVFFVAGFSASPSAPCRSIWERSSIGASPPGAFIA